MRQAVYCVAVMGFIALTLPARGLAGEARGAIQNKDFVVEEAFVENGILTLRQGKDFLADKKFMIFLFLKSGESVQGKTYTVNKDDGLKAGTPHVNVWWKENGNLKSKSYMHGYDMTLKFGEIKGEKVPGEISLQMPKEVGSSLKGTFQATIKK
ncbi:MAG TPA: hypothetical protein VI895_07460 [Bdellovibrionota bacterium]|nr:hypothetical protein [Bdellovibrionota bacterium]